MEILYITLGVILYLILGIATAVAYRVIYNETYNDISDHTGGLVTILWPWFAICGVILWVFTKVLPTVIDHLAEGLKPGCTTEIKSTKPINPPKKK